MSACYLLLAQSKCQSKSTNFYLLYSAVAKNDLCSPSRSIGFEPKTSTLSSQDITESQQLGGNQFDHGKQCGGQLDSHWLSPLGREDPYLWQGTTGWSWEIALDSLLGAKQISTLGDLRTAVFIQALGTICYLGGKNIAVIMQQMWGRSQYNATMREVFLTLFCLCIHANYICLYALLKSIETSSYVTK